MGAYTGEFPVVEPLDSGEKNNGKESSEKNDRLCQKRTCELTEENIQRICAGFGIKCSVIADVVFLTTSAGYWRVYIANNKVTRVFHGNTRMNRTEWGKKHKKFNEEFHRQDIALDNFYDVVQYIFCHDKGTKKRKKTRIESLFEQIEKEGKAK